MARSCVDEEREKEESARQSRIDMRAEVDSVGAEQHRVKVEIFGQTYTLRGPAVPERLTRLAHMVDQQMNALYEQNPRLDLQTLAVLTALNLAEQYDAITSEYEDLLATLEIEAKRELGK